jgi:hypothetical protein
MSAGMRPQQRNHDKCHQKESHNHDYHPGFQQIAFLIEETGKCMKWPNFRSVSPNTNKSLSK